MRHHHRASTLGKQMVLRQKLCCAAVDVRRTPSHLMYMISGSGLSRLIVCDLHKQSGSSPRSLKTSASSTSSSLSADSSTRSSSVALPPVTGESGVARDELELGHRLWPRGENVGVSGVEEVELLEESRVCHGAEETRGDDMSSN